ncbi:MAG TPA: FAD-binding oxidoreductase [Acidobacteriota bacterium]|nr:FAD-binding oxidoreductase [Acidobacteriota bacterium]
MEELKQAYRWISQQPMPPVFAPHDVEEARAWLKEKNHPGSGVLVAGSGSHWFIGGLPDKVSDILWLRRWGRILDYSPGDMMVEVEAGCPLGVLSRRLEEEGQFLPFLPFHAPDSTVGGTVAAALESPFSGELGGPRESLIGVEVLHPEGILSHAGGKVVKNVAGYDLCKLYCGSLGTLGVLTRLVFKVRPLRGGRSSGLMAFGTLSDLLSSARRLRDEAAPAALQVLSGRLRAAAPAQLSEAGWILAVRLLDAPATAAYKRRRIEAEGNLAAWLEGDEEELFWKDWSRQQRELLAPGNGWAALLINTRQANLAQAAADLESHLDASARQLSLTGSFQRASLLAFVREDEDLSGQVQALRQRWNLNQDSLILWKGSAEVKSRIDVWGTPSPLKVLQKRLQQTFDQHGVLNPGRM